MSIGERITELRIQKNLSQGELASALSVSRQAISKWENDQSSPDTIHLIQLADFLDTEVAYLATGVKPVYEEAPIVVNLVKKEDRVVEVEKVVEKPVIRRIVRDNRTRGTSAKATIAMWPSVRRGEDENIFPYQEQADAMFNSALLYELAVLKLYAEPVLFQIGSDEPEYQESKRLLKFLDYFVGIPSEDIPKNSILREFVGGSCFDV